MASNTIIFLCTAGIFGVFALLYVINSIEKARNRKVIQITEHHDRVLRLQQLMDNVPPSALCPEVKMASCREIIRHLSYLTKLDPKSEKFKRRLQEAHIVLEQTRKEAPRNPKLDAVTSTEDLKKVRKAITALFTFIQNATKTGSMEPHIAKDEFAKLKQLFTETGAQFYLNKAQAQQQQGQLRMALQHYRMAVSEYKKAANPEAYQTQIQTTLNTITQLEDEERKTRSVSRQQSGSELSKAYDQLQAEETQAWQKKKF